MLQTMALPGFDLPPSAAVSAISDALKAEFPTRAKRFVLTYLRRHGAHTGEELTDALKAAGINHPKGDKGFGTIYAQLHKDDLTEDIGYGYRRKGNGTKGATIWRITAKGLKA